MQGILIGEGPGLWAAVLAIAAFSFWAGKRTRIGRQISGVAIAIFLAVALANLGVLPRASPVYDAIIAVVLPASIPLLLVRAHFARIIGETGAMLGAFLLGAVATLAGVLAAFHLIDLGENGPALAGIFTATYIGGSMNFAAVAAATGFNESSVLGASVAADQLATNIYIIAIMVLPAIGLVRRAFPSPIIDAAEEGAIALATDGQRRADVAFDPFHVCLALALALVIVALGEAIAGRLGLRSLSILFITALALLPPNLAPALTARLKGAEEVGMIMVFLFLIAIGAGADVRAMLGEALPITAFAVLVILVHLAVILALGRLCRLDLAEILIASNANIGGSTSAGPIAAARGWDTLVTPAILVGVLGNALATFLGVGVVELLR
ncbi:MAG: DUF819 domain-containing protein [Rhodothalassiaceae bacterium]